MITRFNEPEIVTSEPNLIFITGQCGSGKSTLSRMFSTECGLLTFHTGAVYKHHFGNSVKGMDNPDAPTDADAVIKDSLFRFIDREKANGPIVVETVPRSMASINWLLELREKGYNVRVIMIKADPTVRYERVSKRDELNADRVEMDKDKINGECCKWYQYMFDLLNTNKFEIWETEATEKDFIDLACFFAPSIDPILRMYNSALNVYHERDAYVNDRPSFQRMLTRMIVEMDETQQAEHDHHQLEEMMDVLHFMFCAAKALGINNGREFLDAFKKKTHVNQMRLHYGTKKLPQEIIDGHYWKKETN